MPFEIETLDDLRPIEECTLESRTEPRIMSVADLLALKVHVAAFLVAMVLCTPGASLIVGAAKAGKTILAIQIAIAVALGKALFGYFEVQVGGPVLIVEQDDPNGGGSIKTILEKSGQPLEDLPLYVVTGLSFGFGPEFLEWLRNQVRKYDLKLVVLDSYTSLRGPRPKGVDIVKVEQQELAELDSLAKELGCAFLIVHHASKGSANLDWASAAAGTFAMSAATEAQINISRFADLDNAVPERLVRIRGRHFEDLEMVIRFCAETLSFDYVLKGGAASLYPVLLQIETAFGRDAFSPKDLAHATGWSRATAHRHIDRLHRAGALDKRGFGNYAVVDR